MALLLFLLSTGVLEVTTPHYGATISVDREPRGTAPIPALTLPAGLHLVEVHQRGRSPWSRLVFVPPGERVALEVRLADGPGEKNRVESGPYAPPPWLLAGSVGLGATHLGPRDDLDLDQHWTLAAHEPAGARSHLRLDVTAATDLAGDRGFLRTAAGVRPYAAAERTRLALHEARFDARPGPLRLAGGRLTLVGPDQQPLGLDGGQVELPFADAFTLMARAGRRFDPLDQPSRGAAGGLGLHLDTRMLSFDVSHFFNEIHSIEAMARWHDATWSVAGQATVAGADLMATRLDLQRRGATGLALTHHYQGRLFNRPLDLIGLLPPAAPREHRAALTLEAEGLRGHLEGRLPDHATSQQPTVIQGEMAARTPIDGLGLVLSTLLADAPPDGRPALNAHACLALTTHHRPGPRLATQLGLSGLDLRDADGGQRTRLLPTGRMSLEVDLIEPLSLALEGAARAVHPRWAPAGGPLLTGMLELRLR